MTDITIDDPIARTDFEQGRSVQIRATSTEHENIFEKNQVITVHHNGVEMNARIVSDPLLISSDTETKKSVFSLIVEKTNS